MSDSEALRRNRCFGVLGCDSVSAAASSSFKIRVVCDSEALRRNRCFGVLGCDSVSAAASSSFKIGCVRYLNSYSMWPDLGRCYDPNQIAKPDV